MCNNTIDNRVGNDTNVTSVCNDTNYISVCNVTNDTSVCNDANDISVCNDTDDISVYHGMIEIRYCQVALVMEFVIRLQHRHSATEVEVWFHIKLLIENFKKQIS